MNHALEGVPHFEPHRKPCQKCQPLWTSGPTVFINEHGHVECHKACLYVCLYQRSRIWVTESPQDGTLNDQGLGGQLNHPYCMVYRYIMVLRSRLRQSVSGLQQILSGHAIAWYWGASLWLSQTVWAQPVVPCFTVKPHATMHLIGPSSWGKAHWGTSTSRATEFSPGRVPNSGTPCHQWCRFRKPPAKTVERCGSEGTRRSFPRNRFSLRDGLYSYLRFTGKFPLNSGWLRYLCENILPCPILPQYPSFPSCPTNSFPGTGSKCYEILTVDSCWLHVLRSNLLNLSDSSSPFWNPSDCGNNLLHRGHSPLTSENGTGWEWFLARFTR